MGKHYISLLVPTYEGLGEESDLYNTVLPEMLLHNHLLYSAPLEYAIRLFWRALRTSISY